MSIVGKTAGRTHFTMLTGNPGIKQREADNPGAPTVSDGAPFKLILGGGRPKETPRAEAERRAAASIIKEGMPAYWSLNEKVRKHVDAACKVYGGDDLMRACIAEAIHKFRTQKA